MEEEFSEIDVNLRLVDILEYVGDSTRPIREGLAVRDAGHIVCLGYTRKDVISVDALGYVLQSSHPSSKPHEVRLRMVVQDNRRWDFNCSCKAGTRRCKHIMACLMQINTFQRLELMTCTDATQAWGYSKAEKTSLWGAKRIQDLCCVKKAKKIACSDNTLRTNCLADAFDRLLKAAPDSALSKHIAGRHANPVQFRTSISTIATNRLSMFCTRQDLNLILNNSNISFDRITLCIPNAFTDEISETFYHDNIVKTLTEIIDIALETGEQNSSNWKLYRSTRVTASTCYGLFTYCYNSSPDWNKKISQYLNPKTFESRNMRYGKINEEHAFLCYRRKSNPNIKKTGFMIDFEEPWFGASPDGIDPISRIVLEIKCPASGEDHDLAWITDNCNATKKYVKTTIDEDGTLTYFLNKKHAYYAQIQMNMHVLKCSSGDFIIYSKKSDDFILIPVKYDRNFIEQLLIDLKPVYFQKILPKLALK